MLHNLMLDRDSRLLQKNLMQFLGDFTLQLATPRDISEIVRLVESVYRGDGSRRGWTTEADLLSGQRTDAAMIEEMMKNPDAVFLLLRGTNELAGSVYLERRADHVYLGMLSVSASLQNRNLGRALLDLSEAFTYRRWGLSEIRITVIPRRQELISWYQRRGYMLTGAREEFPRDERFGVPKVDDLYFVELKKTIQSDELVDLPLTLSEK